MEKTIPTHTPDSDDDDLEQQAAGSFEDSDDEDGITDLRVPEVFT